MKLSAEIIALPVLEDNYAIIVINPQTHEAILIDTPDFLPIETWIRDKKINLVAIFNTHHHNDHVGANLDFARSWPQLQIYGFGPDAARIPGLTSPVEEGKIIEAAGFEFNVIETPGHTRGHICYFLESGDEKHLFCGDTLFGAGCGKLFEGTPEQMLHSLKKIRNLPDSTLIWCAHEYTEKNLWVATQLEPKNLRIAQAYEHTCSIRAQGQKTIPLQLKHEIEFSPFLRWDCPSLQKTLQTTTELETFRFVRAFRDKY